MTVKYHCRCKLTGSSRISQVISLLNITCDWLSSFLFFVVQTSGPFRSVGGDPDETAPYINAGSTDASAHEFTILRFQNIFELCCM